MKLSAWHKKRGDEVTVLDMSNHKFDRVYASKVFVGGSGYDLKSELPPEIEAVVPDYEGFKADYSIGFTSRGCIRDCGFCIIREKEGLIRETPFDWISHHNVIAKLGCMPFIMIYNNKPGKQLHDFARWVNQRFYEFIPWEEYEQ